MTSKLKRIAEQRRKKIDRIRALGIEPYPHRYQRTYTTQEATALLVQMEGENQTETPAVSIAGRVMANRTMGKTSFIDVHDTLGKIQLYCRNDLLDETSGQVLKDIDIGDIIGASGTMLRTRTGEPSLKAGSLTLLSKSLQPLPEKWHGLSDVDTRFRRRYLDLIANREVKDIFKIRSQVIGGIRQFLNQREFTEVETPVLQPSAGGALARPFITHHNTLDRDFYLRIALELHLKRLIIGGLDKVYELGRTFRNEGVSTRHNPEFTMLESYEAYADYNDVMKMMEEMVASVSQQVVGSNKVTFGDNTIDFQPPWPRLNLREAVQEYSGIDFSIFPDADSLRAEMLTLNIAADPQKDRGRLIDELISTYVEPKLIQPTFLLDYPIEMSPLAKSKPGDETTAERFEAFAGGMEIGNAFSELNDPVEQRQRFIDQIKSRPGENEETWTIDQDFLLALEYGMPPTGGLGVGIDRLVMLLTNKQSIREVILFPQLREKP